MSNLLYLLQLVSPSLPVGAYSYSEGIETLVSQNKIRDAASIQTWIENELTWGSIRIDTAIMVRSYLKKDLCYWNLWLSAVRETQELKDQSHQMGYSLLRLIATLEPDLYQNLLKVLEDNEVNFALIYGALATHWHIPIKDAILGYVHSWVNNLLSAAIKLIPLGQSEGQKILFSLNSSMVKAVEEILILDGDDLYCNAWGLSLASMNHAKLYSRLFRS